MKTVLNQEQQTSVQIQEWDYKFLFIDWLKIKAENNGRWPEINDGRITSSDKYGVFEYESTKHVKHVGSHDTSAQIRVTDRELEISVNPSRYNRTNNIFGCSYGQAIQTIDRILDSLGLMPLREFSILRADVTLNVETGSKAQLDAYIRQLKKITLPKKKTFTKYDSAIFQNGQAKITVYKKGEEMRAHKTTCEELANYCDKKGLARVEVRLKQNKLRSTGLRQGHKVTHKDFENLFRKETSEMPKQTSEELTDSLTNPELGTLLKWKAGYDPRERISRNTYFKHRKAILEKTGIDVSSPMPTRLETKTVTVKTKAAVPPDGYEMPFGNIYVAK